MFRVLILLIHFFSFSFQVRAMLFLSPACLKVTYTQTYSNDIMKFLVHGGVAPYYAKIDTANHALATLSSWKRKSDRYEYSD
ncbi:hypothetical protein C0J52_28323 [Blattella germanica]|nr:hypothetical protein C0J52_28323 [Blattella germanica]